MASAQLLPADSFLTQTSDLMKFVVTELQPDETFNTCLAKAMDDLAAFLKESSRFNVREVVKGGSAGKGTVVKNKSDVDVVVFLNDFTSRENFKKDLKGKLKVLEHELKRHGQHKGHTVRVKGHTQHCVKIVLTPNGSSTGVDMDVLLAYDNLGIHGKVETYEKMATMGPGDQYFCSSSLCSLQVEFVKKQPALLKNLIRLVKYWKKTHFEKRSDMSLPTSYPLELLTIHCWQKAGSPERFDIAKGFKVVLGSLVKYRDIDCMWDVNYNLHNPLFKVDPYRKKPFILDPANPFKNTADRFTACDDVANMAKLSMESACLRGVAVTPSWN